MESFRPRQRNHAAASPDAFGGNTPSADLSGARQAARQYLSTQAQENIDAAISEDHEGFMKSGQQEVGQ
jgi:hypothetical protein